MALDTRQKRMSALCPGSPWRGPMVDATEASFTAGNRMAAAFLYSGIAVAVDPGARIAFAMGAEPSRTIFEIGAEPSRTVFAVGGEPA